MDRVSVYIDNANLYHGCKRANCRTDIDVEKFVKHIVQARQLRRTYIYAAPLGGEDPNAKKAQDRYFRYLNEEVAYTELRLGRLVKRRTTCQNCNHEKHTLQEKGVDLRLGVDMLTHAFKDHYDVAILVSGDSDLVEAVRSVKDLGKHVEIVTFPAGLSQELIKAADTTTKLTRKFLEDGQLFRSPLTVVPSQQVQASGS